MNNITYCLLSCLNDKRYYSKSYSNNHKMPEISVLVENCGGQNNINVMIRYLNMIKEVRFSGTDTLNFYIKGHTNNDCDHEFNSLKIIYQKQNFLTCFLLLFWPPVCEVCPNYELVMFQPRIVNPMDLGSVANCYVVNFLIPVPPFSDSHLMSAWGGYPLMPLFSIQSLRLCLHTGSFAHLGVTCLRPRIMRPVAPCIRIRYLPASPALSTHSRFPTPRPCRRQNLF